MGKYNLLDKSAFVFIFVLVIGLILFSVTALIRPDDTEQKYNFQPFPDISPKDLPDAHSNLGTCYQSLRDCSKNTSCTEEPNNCPGNFSCRKVTSNDNIIFNNAKVPEGKWCIPDQDEMPASCNSITGKLVWTSNPGQIQHWSCECLYPRLYSKDLSVGGASSGDCSVKQACETIKDGKYTTTNNMLKATKYAPKEIQNSFWNPFEPNLATHYNPYQTDEDGKPYFTCSCQNDNQNPKNLLYKDPYSCHNDVCSTFIGSEVNQTECNENGECFCKEKVGSYIYTVPDGPEQGLYFDDRSICGGEGGSWDPNTKCCECAKGIPVKCKNTELGINMDISTECEGQNPVGKTCLNPCSGNKCNGGKCKINESNCSSSPSNGKHYKCECPDSPTKGWCLNPETDCADECLPGGTMYAQADCYFGLCGSKRYQGAGMKLDGSSCCHGPADPVKNTNWAGFGTLDFKCKGPAKCELP